MNLPQLPKPLEQVCVAGNHDGELRDALEDYYTAEQMEAYARATIAAWNVSPSADVVGTFKVGDRVAWTSPFGEVLTGTINRPSVQVTYVVDLDDGTFVAEAQASALSQLAQQGGESKDE